MTRADEAQDTGEEEGGALDELAMALHGRGKGRLYGDGTELRRGREYGEGTRAARRKEIVARELRLGQGRLHEVRLR